MVDVAGIEPATPAGKARESFPTIALVILKSQRFQIGESAFAQKLTPIG